MLAHHEYLQTLDPEKEQEFIEKIFGVMKKTTSKPTKTHEVSRVRSFLSETKGAFSAARPEAA